MKRKLKKGDKVYVPIEFSQNPSIQAGVGKVESVVYDGHMDMWWVNVVGINDASFFMNTLLSDQPKYQSFYMN